MYRGQGANASTAAGSRPVLSGASGEAPKYSWLENYERLRDEFRFLESQVEAYRSDAEKLQSQRNAVCFAFGFFWDSRSVLLVSPLFPATRAPTEQGAFLVL